MELGEMVTAKLIVDIQFAPGVKRVEELERQIKIIGKEWGWWLRPPQTIYTIMCPFYGFSLRVVETQLTNCKIRIIGEHAKVLTDEKVKAK